MKISDKMCLVKSFRYKTISYLHLYQKTPHFLQFLSKNICILYQLPRIRYVLTPPKSMIQNNTFLFDS